MNTKQVDRKHTPHLFFEPRMTPHPDWAADTDYVVGDIRTVDDYEYRCVEDHHSSSLFGDDSINWNRYGHIPYTDTEDPPVDHPVYDLPHVDLDPIPVDFPNAIKVIKKKAFDGHVYLAIHKLRTDIWWQKEVDSNPVRVAQAQLVAQIETSPGVWSAEQPFDFEEANLTKIKRYYVGYIKDDIGPYEDVVFGQIWNFEQGNVKQAFYVDVPGETVRLTWQARVKTSAIADPENDKKGLSYDVSDYEGNVTHTSEDDPQEGWRIHKWTFEPDGFQCPDVDSRTPRERFDDRAGLWIDPYLSIDEQATYIDVTCDGYYVKMVLNNTVMDSARITDNSDDVLCVVRVIAKETDDYFFSYSLPSTTLRVVSPNCVWIRQVGNFAQWGDGGDLADSDGLTVDWVFYQDRFFVHWDWEVSGSITLPNSLVDSAIFQMSWTAANLTSEDVIYDNSGTEADPGAWADLTGDNYVGFVATEMNIITVPIDWNAASGTAPWFMGTGTDGYYGICLKNGTVLSDQNLTIGVFVDSKDRANDGGTFNDWDTDADGNSIAVGYICEQSSNGLRYYCHTAHTAGAGNEPPDTDYWHEYRKTLGDQYKDLVMAAPTTGSEITDMVIPMDLSSDGFASDGARHLEMASDEIEYTVDINRVGHVDVIEDPPIETGTVGSATDHLVGHWKMNDNAANDTIVDTTGNNDGEYLCDSGDTEDITNADAIRGTSLLLTGSHLIDLRDAVAAATTALTSLDDFTIQFWSKPNFGYDTASEEGFFSIGQAYGNGIACYYRPSSDFYRFTTHLGTNTYDDTAAFTSNEELQKWRFFELSLSLTYNIIQIRIDGDVFTTWAISDSWGAAPTYFFLGREHFGAIAYGAFYFDDVKLIDGCMLPYGAYFTGNGAIDTDHAHEDITFLWQGADATPIGSDVTNDGGDYSTDGPIGTKAFDNSDAGDNASAATSGNISAAEGSLSFWFKPNSALGADCTLFYADAAFKIWWDDSDNDVVFTYNTDVLNQTTAFAAGDTNWHHVEAKWDASNKLFLIVDGVVASLLTGVDSAPTLDATMYFTADDADGTNRADVLISDFMITDTMGTPQIPVILGSGPIHAPIRGVE